MKTARTIAIEICDRLNGVSDPLSTLHDGDAVVRRDMNDEDCTDELCTVGELKQLLVAFGFRELQPARKRRTK